MVKCLVLNDINLKGCKLDGSEVEINFSANTELPFGGPLDEVTEKGFNVAIRGCIIYFPFNSLRFEKYFEDIEYYSN